MSASGASFSFHGVDFGGDDYGVYVISRQWPRLPQPRVNRASFAQRDGGVTQGATWDSRRITLECALVASNETNRVIQAANVTEALVLSQDTGPGNLQVDYHAGLLWTNARLMRGVESEIAKNGESFTLEFDADPWPFASSSSSTTVVAADGVAYEFTPGGNLRVPLIWIIKAALDAGSGVVLTNSTTGETGIYGNPLSSGHWLRMDGTNQTFATSSDSGANWTTVSANTLGVVPWAQGGAANSITVQGVAGDVVMEYTAGYRQ